MIQAIQTAYKGYHFRSRLEARWAVFFNAMQMPWEYEPEGFNLTGGVQYLPDFKVANAAGGVTWYEIKPEGVAEDSKFTAFKHALTNDNLPGSDSGVSARLLSGDPFHVVMSGTGVVCPCCGQLEFQRNVEWSCADAFLYCWACDSGPSRELEHGVTGLPVYNHKGYTACQASHWALHVAFVQRAANAARSARFEHGQSGATL